MGSRIWLNHAGHSCQQRRECACGAYPGAYLRNRLAWQREARSRHGARQGGRRPSASSFLISASQRLAPLPSLAPSEAGSYRRPLMLGTSGNPGWRLSSGMAAFITAGTLCLALSGSAGGERVVVPDVVGLDVVSAYDAVHEAGFAVQNNEPIDVTPNSMADVRRQSPTAGTAGRRRTPIVLSLELGPHGLLPMGGTRRVPRLVGRPLPDAVHRLQTLGLLSSAAPIPPLPASVRPSLLDNYRVTEQSPKPGTRFTQTVTRQLNDGSVLTKTSTVGLAADLSPN
jgi:hypothetical protein